MRLAKDASNGSFLAVYSVLIPDEIQARFRSGADTTYIQMVI